MKVKVNSLTLILLFVSHCSHAQEAGKNDGSVIVWNEYYTLGWQDFEGKRTEEAIGDAGSVVQIKAKPYLVKNKVKYEVAALFLRNKSWVSDPSEELLIHERLHFDIAELCARKIRKKIQELSNSKITDIKIYNTLIQELLEESNTMDRQYDIETLHGALLKKQKQWEAKVKDELRELESFKKSRQVISSGR
jgi:hypothetical protein